MTQLQVLEVESAVHAARDLFWDRGYEAVTLAELEEVTGHESSYLHHTFGSKRGLYDAAVNNYLDTVIRPQLHVLVTSSDPRQALLGYFEWLTNHIAGQSEGMLDGGRALIRGCLLLDSAAGIAAHDAEQQKLVTEFCAELESTLAGALQRADPSADADAIVRKSRLLVAVVSSAMLLARVDPDRAVGILATADDLIW